VAAIRVDAATAAEAVAAVSLSVVERRTPHGDGGGGCGGGGDGGGGGGGGGDGGGCGDDECFPVFIMKFPLAFTMENGTGFRVQDLGFRGPDVGWM